MTKLKTTLFILTATFFLTACGNQTFFDTTYTFKYAQIKLPDGRIKTGQVKEWKDYSDGDTMQVKFEDGTVYYTHSTNVVLSVDQITAD